MRSPIPLKPAYIRKPLNPEFWLTASLRYLFRSYTLYRMTRADLTKLHEAVRQAEVDGYYRSGD